VGAYRYSRMLTLLTAAVLCVMAAACSGHAAAGSRAPATVNITGPPDASSQTSPTSSTSLSSSPSPSSSSSSPTPSTRLSSSASSSPAGTACVTSSPDGNCGPYSYSGIVSSNGYDTYVGNNCWADPSCKQTVTAHDPGDWSVTSTEPAGNTGVKTYPDVSQLTNSWCPADDNWNTCATGEDAPVSSLSSLTSTYSESMPHNGETDAEAGYDIWTNYSSDIMIWVDNVNRGAGGAAKIGTAVIGGQNFTVYRYGGAGGEIIFSLDGTGGTGTFANQQSGTVNILGALDWVQSNGYASDLRISQIDFGWEICSTGGAPETFSLSQYGIKAA
jgi:Glycosyl hydrolase family 12